ncbi:MAG: hypothetical protein Q8L80_00600, partial [Gallionella sp.]|nr:hypothetical protein [Gallionella sp.]
AGATPGHVITKPEAGTGATMFVDVCSLISMGSVAPAMSLPDSDVEVGKSLTSLFSEGANIIFYDNVKDAVSSTELASAMTGKKYRARLLGRSATVEVAVRVVWVFTANNFEGTKELLRRFIFIPMDAMLTNPEERVPVDGWRHPDLMGWVEEHRAELVHACLTIIQSWVAKGMLRQTKVKRGGFEDWSAVMGGILENAGIEGFLCGQKEEQDKARDDGQEGQQALVDVMAEYPSDTTWFRPGSSKPPGAGKDPAVNIQDLLNGADRFDLDSYGDAPSPIVIDNWGYKDFTSKYENAVLIGRRMVNFARKPHLSGDWIIHLEMSEDNHGKKYRMWKEPVKVKLTVIDGGKQDMAA